MRSASAGDRFSAMPGHRRPKDGVLWHTYVPGIYVLLS
jgi:hypothetical protein